MTDIYLSVDVGGSQTKIIYQVDDQTKPSYLLLSPEIEEITKDKLNFFMERLGWIGSPSPDQQLWVEWNNRVVVLGEFAANFDPLDRIKELKYENALWKVLGAVGLIIELSKVKVTAKKQIYLELALLLPWNEYSDRRRFEEQLRVMLADFRVRQQYLKVNLERFLCRPEGGGLAALRIKQQGVDWLRNQQLAVLMFGHRNTTALYFDRGQLKLGDSPLLGFANMLDIVLDMTSGLDRERLSNAIFDARYAVIDGIYNQNRNHSTRPDWISFGQIQALASAKDPSLRQKEISQIADAIRVATSQYWDKLQRWMDKILPRPLNEVIIGGGAAYHVEVELEKYFNCAWELQKIDKYSSVYERTGEYIPKDDKLPMIPMVWGSGFITQVQETFDLDSEQTYRYSTSARLVDCFGMFDYLLGMETSQ
ncbi:ParM/StbA family protein [Nostoc punctiforme FACHB-252]|uniref:ParM/StbA family protein n=1 Tax=Nostoc punctiforme FACHB-252 TaxID=1357509 RepID=A0ABR8HMQ3_NOSPU|nr:ParM/StbA family protein [Nostoc punctiforme]MBD2616250.1 ParM/StbA family protein [Nostoc punctiforme FACHB-252]